MEKIINIGIIGAGIVGERLIKIFKKHSRANILGVYDVNQERLEYVSKEYDLPTVQNYEELLKNDDIDLIYIGVPPKHHHSIAMDIIAARKNIICEKPLANSIEEAKEMYEKAKETNIVHSMNFPTVYTPAFKKLRELLGDGFIGNLRRVELHTYFSQWPRPWQQTNWVATREQGGFVREVFTHYIQMIQMLFGKIKEINTSIQYPENALACETGIIATGVLPNGTPVLFNGFSDMGLEENLSFTLYGTKGSLSIVNWRELWTTSKGEKKVKVELEEHDHLCELVGEVFKSIDNKEGNIVTFKEGYDAQVIIEDLLGNTSAL